MLNRRILIVDDNEEIHCVFRKTLSPAGMGGLHSYLNLEYIIDSNYSEIEALKKLEDALEIQQPYSLVFVQVQSSQAQNTPFSNTLAQTIQEHFPFTEVVLMVSSEDRQWMSKGFPVLVKPLDPVAIQQMSLGLTSNWNIRQLRHANAELVRANCALELNLRSAHDGQASIFQVGKLAALGEMTAGIAHEINNPLCIIQMRSAQLQEYIPKEKLENIEVQRCTKAIEATIARIANIITALRAFSRDSAKERFEPTKLKRILFDALIFCSERLKNHGVELRQGPYPEDLTLECRSAQISQVLSNLLMNSFDALQGCSEKWIEIEFINHPHDLEISVTDSGQGILEKDREKIFQPFFTTKDIGKGTGLGLSASRGMIEEHHGTLRLDSSSLFTRFVIVLPKTQQRT